MPDSLAQITVVRAADGWTITTPELPNGRFARALAHWIGDTFSAETETDGAVLTVSVTEPEQVESALDVLLDRLGNGQPPFDALGEVACAVAAGEPLRATPTTESTGAAPTAEPASDEPGEQLEAVPSRFEQIGVPVESTSAETIDAPPNRFESIGDPAPRAALPDASDPGRFDIHLVEKGADDGRTAALLAAAIRVGEDEAVRLVREVPVLIAAAVDARVARQIDTILRASRGATVEALPADPT